MAEVHDGAPDGSSKPMLVRIKRKRFDEPIDVFWLEQNASKRQEVDLSNLSLDAPPSSEVANTKLLFRRVETVQTSNVNDISLAESLMEKITCDRSAEKQEARRSVFKKKNKPLTGVREQHEKVSKLARYKQVWRSRKGNEADTMQDFFRLYDVVREDVEADEQRAESELLKKYLPLLKEFLPEEFGEASPSTSSTLPEEFGEASPSTSAEPSTASADEFVYDVYAQEQTDFNLDEDEDEYYTLRVVVDTSDYGLDELKDSDYDSEDSNREDHPLNEYPEEEDEDEFEDEEDENDSSDDNDHEENGTPDQEKFMWRIRR